MTKSRTLLLCSTAVLLTFGAASQAATPAPADPAPALAANSYADLLAPIPDAVAQLQADDLARVQAAAEPRFQLARSSHHHHSYHSSHYSHHHHHSHHHSSHNSYYPWGVIPGFGPPPPTYYRPEHCYWTWSDPYWDGRHWARRRVKVCD